MDQPNFADILDEAPETIDRPKPLPPGPYHCIVIGQPRQDVSKKQRTPFVEFTLRPIEALKGVDEDALEEMGGLEKRTLRNTFYLTPDAIYRLDIFLDHLGLPPDGKTTRAAKLAESVNRECIAYVSHSMSDDGISYANVTGTAAVE